ncbi:MAG: LTA synthase family protein [Succinivibrionaceae bacterium]
MFCNHTYDTALRHLRFSLSAITASVILGMLIFAIARVVFVINFGLDEFLQITSFEFFDYLSKTVRFDLKYVFITLIPLVVFSLICPRQRLAIFFKKIYSVVNAILLLFLVIISVVNYFYYLTYEHYIDVFLFGFFKEDPLAIIKTVISDYPLVRGLLGIVVAMIVLVYCHKFLQLVCNKFIFIPKSKTMIVLQIMLLVSVYVIGIRGSLSTFPLREYDAQVSNKKIVNDSVPNGLVALNWAYKWYRIQNEFPIVKAKDILLDYNDWVREGGNNLLEPLTWQEDYQKDPAKILDFIHQRTQKNEYLSEHKPDVVIAIMESMSSHMMSFDDPKNYDLYGELRRHMKEDFYFKNFISEGNGTIDSITRLLVSVPNMDFSTTNKIKTKFYTSFIAPFKSQGYEVYFITTGNGSWRNLNRFVTTQGVDHFIEKSTIREVYPNATENVWGVDDKYLFDYTNRFLQQKSDKPRLVFLLSITNHPPYQLPKGADSANVMPRTDVIKQRFPYEEPEMIFSTLRYANDELGKFITNIKENPELSQKTVVAATGDHNLRGIGYGSYPEEIPIGYAVPFYLYLPKAYKNNTSINYDPEIYGSHRDILPTVINHVLDNQDYYSFGCDLLADNDSKKYCKFDFQYNESLYIQNGIACSGVFSIKLKNGLIGDLKTKDKYDCLRARKFEKLYKDVYLYQITIDSQKQNKK